MHAQLVELTRILGRLAGLDIVRVVLERRSGRLEEALLAEHVLVRERRLEVLAGPNVLLASTTHGRGNSDVGLVLRHDVDELLLIWLLHLRVALGLALLLEGIVRIRLLRDGAYSLSGLAYDIILWNFSFR